MASGGYKSSSSNARSSSQASNQVKSRVASQVKSRAKRKVKNKIRKSPIIIAILVLLAVAAFLMYNYGEEWFGISLFEDKETVDTAPTPSDGEVLYHFIDVGQGDAILVTSRAGNMLIDTSESGERDKLVAYLDRAGIKTIKYLVLTHTDADHIGNADYVILNYNVENVLLPDYVATTKTYDRMMDAIEERQANLILIGEEYEGAGYTFRLGSVLNTVIAPVKDYNDPNDMSIVMKSTYGETSVMFTGDAEEKPEADLLKYWDGDDLRCDVLKVGHHGSKSSTTEAFLSAVSPTIAVISCGKDNSYGHPHASVLNRLEAHGVTVYRTDEDGTVVLKTDGVTFVYVE